MRYDLGTILQLCEELGLSAIMRSDQRIDIGLGQGVTLYFQNADRDEDCLMGFLDVAWHTHGDVLFADAHGNSIELNYLDVLVGLSDGQVLVCELQSGGRAVDRLLIHSKYSDEFRHLRLDEQIVVRRAAIQAPDKQT